jgi:hypothetical protein
MVEAEFGARQLFYFFMLACFIWGAWKTFVPILEVRAAERWPSVAGTVITSAPALVTSDNEGFYRPDVHYTYRVGVTDYDGTRLCFGEPRLSESAAAEMTDRYPARAKVHVHYDPAKPENAVLERRTYLGGFGTALMMVLALAAGAVVMIWSR